MSFLFSFIKSRDLSSIKQKLILLYILNVSDVIFTLFLINTGMFLEANAVMAPIINNRQIVSIVIKIFIPLILLLGVYVRMKQATENQLYMANIIITAGLVLYIIINISHLVCSIAYIVFNIFF